MKTKEPIHVSKVVGRLIEKLKPKKKGGGEAEVSIEQIEASIAERQEMRRAMGEMMRMRWLIR